MTEIVVSYETQRAREQSPEEWLKEYEGVNESSTAIALKAVVLNSNQRAFCEKVKNAGIVSLRRVGDDLLVTLDRPLTKVLDNAIRKKILKLDEISEPETGDSLYKYEGYRTFFSNKKPCLAIVFKEVHTGIIAERYFNIDLRNAKGKSFATGINREFRIVGNAKSPAKGSFIKFWMDAVKYLPDERASHIFRYMNSGLGGVVVSCADAKPHHDDIKLVTLKYEGHLYHVP